MRVMVTGATGFVGAWTTKALVDAGHEVRALVRSPDRLDRNLEPIGVEVTDYVVGDMTDAPVVRRAVAGCDAVLHAAAFVSTSRRHAPAMLEANPRGAQLVLGAGLDAGCDPVVHVSSVSALFRPGLDRLHADLPVADAETAYGRSKATAETVARSLQAEGAPVTITYPGGVLGPGAGDAFGESAAGLALLLRIRVSPRAAHFPIVDVRDVAAVHAAAMVPGRGPRRYLCGGKAVPIPELAAILNDITGCRFAAAPVPGRVMRAVGSAADGLTAVVPFHTPITHEAMVVLTQLPPTDDRPAVDELGVHFRPPRDTLADTIASLCEAGRLRRRMCTRL